MSNFSSQEITFLKGKFPNIFSEDPVWLAVNKFKAQTGRISGNAEDMIEIYISRLSWLLFDDVQELTEDEKFTRERRIDFIREQIFDVCILKVENIPESYWSLQMQINKNDGWGDIDTISDNLKCKHAEILIEDQKASLNRWIWEIISQDLQSYSPVLRYWGLRSVTKLMEYDKWEKKFPKRSKGTVKLFPDLNNEALVWVFITMQKFLSGEKIENPIKKGKNKQAQEWKLISDEAFQKILTRWNFADLYAFAIEYVTQDYSELWKETRGEWRIYCKGEENKLTWDLQWYGTGWCTAGIWTAKTQLQAGDFYVYYSFNDLWVPKIPRLAIRMEGWNIREVRWVDRDQNADPNIWSILEKKMDDFWEEGLVYKKKSQDMRRMTELYKRHQEWNTNFSKDELRFLYEIDSKILTFALESDWDIRIDEILQGRNRKEDLIYIFLGDISPEDKEIYSTDNKNSITSKTILFFWDIELEPWDDFSHIQHVDGRIIIGNTKDYYQKEQSACLIKFSGIQEFVRNIKKFSNLDAEIASNLIQEDYWKVVARNIERFDILYHNKIAQKLLEVGEVDVVIKNLHNFKRLENNTAQKLIELRKIANFIKNLRNFEWLNNNTAQKLIEAWALREIASNIRNFEWPSHKEIALELIEKGVSKHVAENMQKFECMSHKEIALKIIEKGLWEYVARNIRNFKWLDKEIALKLIDIGEWKYVGWSIPYFTWLDREIALKLIEIGISSYPNSLIGVVYRYNGYFELDLNWLQEVYREARERKK